ncbi:MAG: hypothetical protein HOP07_13055 [Bacteriovoracaceae bacterium]|nr:hypothetical protein [Bacteriovoracaceae bacterium]
MTKNVFGRTCGGAKQRNDGANVNSKKHHGKYFEIHERSNVLALKL